MPIAPISHVNIFRDPTEVAGLDLRPRYPLVGPYGFWDTRDHDWGPTGFVVQGPGDPGVGSTGTLPNTGSAGSAWDLEVDQSSAWNTVPSAYASYTADIFASQFGTVDITAKFGAQAASESPWTFVSVLGTLEHLSIGGVIQTHGGRQCQIEFYPNGFADGPWTARMEHQITATSGSQSSAWEDDSFYPYPDTALELLSDVIPGSVLGFDMFNAPIDLADIANKLAATVILVPTGLTDTYFGDTWMSDDVEAGYPPGFWSGGRRFDWWGLGDANNADREVAYPAFQMAADSHCDSAYDMVNSSGWRILIDGIRQYNQLPVEGQPWNLFRGWALYRGVPTAADLAAIKADFGV